MLTEDKSAQSSDSQFELPEINTAAMSVSLFAEMLFREPLMLAEKLSALVTSMLFSLPETEKSVMSVKELSLMLAFVPVTDSAEILLKAETTEFSVPPIVILKGVTDELLKARVFDFPKTSISPQEMLPLSEAVSAALTILFSPMIFSLVRRASDESVIVLLLPVIIR